jgi:hypothetical protein
MCTRELPYVKSGGSNPDGWTEEHIVPIGFGNAKFLITLCGNCNGGLNQRFEMQFLRRPEIRYGVRLAGSVGRSTSHASNPGVGFAGRILTPGKESIHKLEVKDGQPETRVIQRPLGSTANLVSPYLDEDFLQTDELTVLDTIPFPNTSILEAIKIGFEQLFWHLGSNAFQLEIADFMRSILNLKPDTNEFSNLFSPGSERSIKSLSFTSFPDPVQTEFGEYIEMHLQFPSSNLNLTEKQMAAVKKTFSDSRKFRANHTHDLQIQIVSQTKKTGFLLLQYDFYGKAFGQVMLPILECDITLLGKDFMLRDWIHWDSGKHQNVKVKSRLGAL